MDPPPPRCMTGTTAFVSMNGAARFTVKICWSNSMEVSSRLVDDDDRGVVHEYVDSAVKSDSLVDDALGLTQVAQIGDDDRRLPAFLLNHLQGLLSAILDDVDEHHTGTFACEQHRHGFARPQSRTAGPGSGHDCHLACKPARFRQRSVLLGLLPGGSRGSRLPHAAAGRGAYYGIACGHRVLASERGGSLTTKLLRVQTRIRNVVRNPADGQRCTSGRDGNRPQAHIWKENLRARDAAQAACKTQLMIRCPPSSIRVAPMRYCASSLTRAATK